MIVLSQTDSDTYGVVTHAPNQIYEPVEIQGNLWVLPDQAEQSVVDRSIAYTKRAILDSEWIVVVPD